MNANLPRFLALRGKLPERPRGDNVEACASPEAFPVLCAASIAEPMPALAESAAPTGQVAERAAVGLAHRAPALVASMRPANEASPMIARVNAHVQLEERAQPPGMPLQPVANMSATPASSREIIRPEMSARSVSGRRDDARPGALPDLAAAREQHRTSAPRPGLRPANAPALPAGESRPASQPLSESTQAQIMVGGDTSQHPQTEHVEEAPRRPVPTGASTKPQTAATAPVAESVRAIASEGAEPDQPIAPTSAQRPETTEARVADGPSARMQRASSAESRVTINNATVPVIETTTQPLVKAAGMSEQTPSAAAQAQAPQAADPVRSAPTQRPPVASALPDEAVPPRVSVEFAEAVEAVSGREATGEPRVDRPQMAEEHPPQPAPNDADGSRAGEPAHMGARLSPIGIESAGMPISPTTAIAPRPHVTPVVTVRAPGNAVSIDLTEDHPQRLTLEVNPPELGRCELELSLHEGRVRASVIAERPETALALRAVEGQIREQLASRDLHVVEFDIRAGTQHSGQQGLGQDAFHDGAPRRQPPAPMPHARRLPEQSTAAPRRETARTSTIDLIA